MVPGLSPPRGRRSHAEVVRRPPLGQPQALCRRARRPDGSPVRARPVTGERKLARADALVALHRLRRALGSRADASRIDMLATIVEDAGPDESEHELASTAAGLFPDAPDAVSAFADLRAR